MADVDITKETLRERILETATSLFGERGVTSTSMREIAEALGVTKGALYYHFENKDQLHLEIHLRLITSILEQLEEIAASEATYPERIRRVVELTLRLIAEQRDAFAVLLREGGRLESSEWVELAVKRDQFRKQLEGLIRGATDTGVFQVKDVGVATLALLGMCNWSYTWIELGGQVSVEDIARQFADIFIDGVRVR
jgi:TetR/AcrR family transcriptional regulator, cholesterol catabolism regulator